MFNYPQAIIDSLEAKACMLHSYKGVFKKDMTLEAAWGALAEMNSQADSSYKKVSKERNTLIFANARLQHDLLQANKLRFVYFMSGAFISVLLFFAIHILPKYLK